jgi:uncharacterized DUF497 family protein/predicted DNA binding CopG/RHH family protein
MIDLSGIERFEWDEGDARKNLDKQDVSQAEAEQIFVGEPLIAEDAKHSQDEPRYQALGSTIDGRRLHVTFTLRDGGRKIRVISARDMNRKERASKEPPMGKTLKPIPKFRSEAEERKFWETHDSTDYVDWSKAQRARFPNLKLSTTTISLRMPQGTLDRIKIAANKRDVPYQSLIKVWLEEKLDAE